MRSVAPPPPAGAAGRAEESILESRFRRYRSLLTRCKLNGLLNGHAASPTTTTTAGAGHAPQALRLGGLLAMPSRPSWA